MSRLPGPPISSANQRINAKNPSASTEEHGLINKYNKSQSFCQPAFCSVNKRDARRTGMRAREKYYANVTNNIVCKQLHRRENAHDKYVHVTEDAQKLTGQEKMYHLILKSISKVLVINPTWPKLVNTVLGSRYRKCNERSRQPNYRKHSSKIKGNKRKRICRKNNKMDTWESLLAVQTIYTYNKLRTFQCQFLIEGTSCIFGIKFRGCGSKYFTTICTGTCI
jgi:hypothetical protein